jgi:catechol 2,3-dioxygenase-like lactoylglutathione lyase family enzyme
LDYKIHHLHAKSLDPKGTADWFVNAFNFKIVSDTVRHVGDRFIRMEDAGGAMLIVSGPRTGEKLVPAIREAHLGLEHLALRVANLSEELGRLTGLGAELVEGPVDMPGMQIAFLLAPGGVRVELMQIA